MSGNTPNDNQIEKSRYLPVPLRLIIIICWVTVMVLIFWFSSKPAGESTVQSHNVDTVICHIVIKNFKTFTLAVREYYIEHVDKIVRKTAHFLEYALLGVLTWLFFNLSLLPLLAKHIRHKVRAPKAAVLLKFLILPVGWCCLYSVTDEIHQLFSEGRYASPVDVLIDTSGALFGVLFLLLIRKIILAIRKKKGLRHRNSD